MRPAADALVVIGLGAVAVLAGAALGGSTAAPFPHEPAPPAVRVMLAAAWAVAQAASLAAVYFAGHLRFAKCLGASAVLGVAAMAAGRAGLTGLWSGQLLVVLIQVVLVAVAAAFWCALRPAQAVSAWRLFYWMSLTGAVYLYTAHPAVASAHQAAVGLTLVSCGALAFLHPALVRVLHRLEDALPGRLSVVVWLTALALLLANVWWVRATGSSTPQVRIGPGSVAPYFLAVALVVFALTLDMRAAATAGWRRLVWPMVAAGIVAVIYIKGLGESGTMVVLFLSAMTATLLVGTPFQAAASLGLMLLAGAGLRWPVLLDFITNHLPRAGQRLQVWAGQVAPPDQLSRAFEVIAMAGILGHTGASRLQFLIGPQVGKDFALALVLANGGWVGLGLVSVAALLLIIELYRAARLTRGALARTIQTSVLAVLLGSVLASTLWIAGLTPFVGVPLVPMSRGGSHLVVLAMLLFLFEAAAAVGTPRQEWRRAA
jgi:cell division protein FtsW (lipid II flippase)